MLVEMMKPNMKIADNDEQNWIEIIFDVGDKSHHLRKQTCIIKDGVYVNTEKSIMRTIEQLEKLIVSAKDFIGIHKKYP